MSKSNKLLLSIVIAVILAVLTGWALGPKAIIFELPGVLFLNSLKMIIIPLIFAAVVKSVISLRNSNQLGKIGLKTFLYYFITTSVSVLIGLILVNMIAPGEGLETLNAKANENILTKKDMGPSDLILSFISPNIINAMAEGKVLPVIFFAIIFSLALGFSKTRYLDNVFDEINDAMMKIVSWIMFFTPIGVFGLITARFAKVGGAEQFITELKGVAMYVLTVILGLFIHFLVLFLVSIYLGKKNIYFLKTMMNALLTAFGTASSSATLPITIECAKEAGIKSNTRRFILPLGSTVNMDGTALYEAVAVMFIAQSYGIEMSFTQQAIIFVTATLAAIGAAGIPEAGLVTMVLVLQSVGLPLDGIGLLLAVDWFLDRFRTTVNVWGDSVGCTVIDRSS